MDPFAPIAEAYEAWYETPLGAFVIAEEEGALLRLLPPGESLLEVGAGTGTGSGASFTPRRWASSPRRPCAAWGRPGPG